MTLGDYLAVVRRRWSLVVLFAIVVPAAAVAFSFNREESYQASAQVLLSRLNLATALNDIVDSSATRNENFAATQASLASVPLLAERTLRAADIRDRTPEEFLEQAAATPKKDTDILVFAVQDRRRDVAKRLATEYARQFTIFRRELDERSLTLAERELDRKLSRLLSAGAEETPLYADLVQKQQQLEGMKELVAGNALVIQPANDARALRVSPVRSGLLGLAVGLILGVIAAFLAEAVNPRFRSAEALASALQLRLLALLPRPSRGVRKSNGLSVVGHPTSAHAAAIRMLRTSIDFANRGVGAQTLLITSPTPGDGKSTTAANLAAAFAQAGRRTVLVDLDLHRPTIARFFDSPFFRRGPGVRDIARGEASLADALRTVPVGESDARMGNGRRSGSLRVVPAGAAGVNPPELAANGFVPIMLRVLRADSDIVIIDGPALLSSNDAMELSAHADAILVVVRLNTVTTAVVKNLRRMLDDCAAVPLGFAITAAEGDNDYRLAQPLRSPHQRHAPPRLRPGEGAAGVATGGGEGSARPTS